MKTRQELQACILGISLQERFEDELGLFGLSQLTGQDQQLARQVYFEMDRLDIWQKIGPHPSATTAVVWVRKHLDHALAHCPQLVALWSEFSQAEGLHFVDEVGQVLDQDPRLTDAQRLSILQGKPCSLYPALRNSMKTAMGMNADSYKVLSPFWIGKEGSDLRRHAQDHGWVPEMLAGMIRKHAEKDHAWQWIAHMPYAYTLMLLNIHLEGRTPYEARDSRWDKSEWPICMCEAAWPCDVVAARAVLAHMDLSKRRCTLVLSPEAPQRSEPSQDLSQEEVARLDSLVSVHMGMGCEQALVQHFTTQSLMATPSGTMGPVKPMESLALPELGTPT